MTIIERPFNRINSETRVIIEQSFSLLKGRFIRLKLCETQRLDIISSIILSACILHNLCIQEDDIPNDINLERELEEERLMNVNKVLEEDENINRVRKRSDIVNSMYFQLLRR